MAWQLCNPDTDNVYQMSLELEKKTKVIDELTQRIEALERLVKATQTAWREPGEE